MIFRKTLLATLCFGSLLAGSPGAIAEPIDSVKVQATTHPLVARYSLNLPRAARMRVEFGPDQSYGRTTWWRSAPTDGGRVEVLVAGMKPSQAYHMRGVVEFSDGKVWTDADHLFTTGAPPAGRVTRVETRGTGAPTAPGVELLNLVPIPYPPVNATAATTPLNAVVHDMAGNLIWYYDHATLGITTPMRLLPNGNMLLILVKYMQTQPDALLREVDLEGVTRRELTIPELNSRLRSAKFDLEAYQFHHEVLPLPNGHFMALIDTYREFRDLPGHPGTFRVLGDALVDLDADWRPVWVWNAFDHLDVHRHLFGLPDWTHGNSLAHDSRDGSLLLSMRHQSWIVKIDYRDGSGPGKVLWRLGNGGDFRLDGGDPAQWFYGQHVPELLGSTKDGIIDLAVFDNGNLRVLSTKGETMASRAVKLRIDEVNKTARVTWEKRLPWFSDASGGVATLQPGHFEYTAGWLRLSGHVGEVLDDGSEVWSMEPQGQKIYRAQRLPSLYPGVTWSR